MSTGRCRDITMREVAADDRTGTTGVLRSETQLPFVSRGRILNHPSRSGISWRSHHHEQFVL